jgi:hypothetical protein
MANRLLTINIRKYLSTQPVRKRHARISRYVRRKIAQQTNIRADNIKINKDLNAIIQTKYLHSMKPLKLNINTEKDITTVTYFDKTPKPATAANVETQTTSKTGKPSTEVKAEAPKTETKSAQTAQKTQKPKKETEKKEGAKEVKT